MTVKATGVDREVLMKRIFFLLYEACGGPRGMGILQARNGVTEDEVWKNVFTGGDYPGDIGKRNAAQGKVYGDYVFGRMMKWGIRFGPEAGIFKLSDNEFRPDYQGFCPHYRNNKEILDAAVESLGVGENGYEIIDEGK